MNIEIKGKQYPISFTYATVYMFCESEGIELYEYWEKLGGINFNKLTLKSQRILNKLFLCAIKRGCEVEKIDFDLTENDIMDYVFSETEKLFDVLKALNGSIGEKKKEEVVKDVE